jgi:small subunit ribosomal protein S20
LAKGKASQENVRLTEKRRLRNKSISTLCKTNIIKAEKFIFSGELDSAKAAVLAAVSSLDKAAERGVLHPNNVARRKARLMSKLNSALAASSGKKAASAS